MITLSPLNTHHAPACLDILNACFALPWNDVEGTLTQAHTLGIGAFLDSTLIGFILITHTFETAEILNLAVHPTHQHNGIATQLINTTLNTLRQRKCERVFLEVDETNVTALNLYTKLGFEHIYTRNNYYKQPNGTFHAALTMQRMLNN
jgi:[ribosomal protein S18]-alanine N-acetyltransferase